MPRRNLHTRMYCFLVGLADGKLGHKCGMQWYIAVIHSLYVE